jgi:hypothetical protein
MLCSGIGEPSFLFVINVFAVGAFVIDWQCAVALCFLVVYFDCFYRT